MNLNPENHQQQQQQLSDADTSPSRKVTNQNVLLVTTILFAGFVIAVIIGALAGNSLSLLGDGAAMSVDVLTYCTNMYAERIKSSGREIDEKTRMFMEVYIPSFSVMSLLAVTGWITSDAITVIINKGHDSDEVNVYFLYGFASANVLVDAISSLMFYFRGSEAFRDLVAAGFMNPLLNDLERAAVAAAREQENAHRKFLKDSSTVDAADDDALADVVLDVDADVETNIDKPANVETADVEAGVPPDSAADETAYANAPESRLNLNMCSALTHLGGDSMRTCSVFIAAVVTTTTDVSGNLCDAWAAIIVTVTIVGLVIPLIYQIYKAATYQGRLPIPVMV